MRRIKTGRLFQSALLGCILCLPMILQSCKSQHAVLAASNTVLGVELKQKETTQTPQGTFGYSRQEFAYVPTNRSTKEDASGSFQNGAADVPDVLMELRYDGILTLNSSLYQRLAVGETAVIQPGAAFMLAKNKDGVLDATTSANVSKALTEGAKEILEKEELQRKQIIQFVETDGKVSKENLTTLAKTYDADTQKALDENYAEQDIAKFNKALNGSLKTYLNTFVANIPNE